MRLIDPDRVREFNTKVAADGYSITFKTYDRKAYEQVQSLCRLLVDGKDGEAIPIEYIEAFKKKVRHIAPAKAVIDWLIENWEDEQARLFEKQITEECVSAERFADWGKENENRVE